MYTKQNAPDWVKKLPTKAKDGWIKAFNAALEQYKDETRAFKVANAVLTKMGYKKKGDKWIKVKESSLRESAPMGSFEYLRNLVRAAIEEKNPFASPTGVGEVSIYPYIRYMFLTHVIFEVDNKFYDIAFVLSVDNKSVTLGEPVEVEEIFVAKEADITYAGLSEQRGEGMGVGGSRQGDGGADKCICPKCKKEYPHTKGVPCSKVKCPKCGVALVGKVLKECVSLELQEAGIAVTKEAQNIDLDIGFISLKEASYNSETGELEEVVIIEAGTNEHKRRHYPVAVVEKSASSFSGLKMYLNHPTSREEKERPERNIKDWASTITEAWYDNGKAMGNVAVHDQWLRERLADSVAREHIGLSINTSGRISYGTVRGKEMQIVEEILVERQNGPGSVDWVTEAGARGRVSKLLKESNQKEEKTMDLKEATFEDLKRDNPTLMESVTEHIKNDLGKDVEGKKKDVELKEAQNKVKTFEAKELKEANQKLIETGLKESKNLPDLAKEKIKTEMADMSFANETELKEALGKKIKFELNYLNKVSSKGRIQTGSGDGETSLVESTQSTLEKRLGIAPEKKKSEDNR